MGWTSYGEAAELLYRDYERRCAAVGCCPLSREDVVVLLNAIAETLREPPVH
jgi:hypothetical protein